MKHRSDFWDWTFKGQINSYCSITLKKSLVWINDVQTDWYKYIYACMIKTAFLQACHLMFSLSGLWDPKHWLQQPCEQCSGLLGPVCKPPSVAFEWDSNIIVKPIYKKKLFKKLLSKFCHTHRSGNVPSGKCTTISWCLPCPAKSNGRIYALGWVLIVIFRQKSVLITSLLNIKHFACQLLFWVKSP